MSQNTVIYLATDKDGEENIFEDAPDRMHNEYWENIPFGNKVTIPTGTIKKLTGKDLTWDSGYIQYVGENYDPTPE